MPKPSSSRPPLITSLLVQLPGQLAGGCHSAMNSAAHQPGRSGRGRGHRQRDERIQIGAELLGDGVFADVTDGVGLTAASSRSPTQRLSAPSCSAVDAKRDSGSAGGGSELRHRESEHDRQANAHIPAIRVAGPTVVHLLED